MPELPEVETIKNGLAKTIVGHKIKQIEVFSNKSFLGKKERLLGSEIVLVERRGKNLIVSTDRANILLIHLKMTGQLIYLRGDKRLAGGHPSRDWLAELPNKHTRVMISFSNNSRLFFNDLRKFGWIKIIKNKDKQSLLSGLGPEPLQKNFNDNYLFTVANKYPKRTIKQLLLDQSIVAGIGNIYADEALFLAKINPQSRPADLAKKDYQNLVTSVKKVLRLSLLHGGTSDRDYLNIEGKKGGMQNYLHVYHRQDQDCLLCGEKIVKIKLAGRGTHYCPNCQKGTTK